MVLEHVKGGVSEEGGASHGLVARLLLRATQLLHHPLTVSQQLIQTQLPAAKHSDIVRQRVERISGDHLLVM